MGLCGVFTGSVIALFTIVGFSIIIASLVRISDDEICEVFYVDGVAKDNIQTKTSPGIVFSGPIPEKHCVTRSTQHLTFDKPSNQFSSSLGRLIATFSQEGVPIVLEVDVEFKYIPGRFDDTVQRTGFGANNDRLMRTARSEIRNVASEFVVDAYLIGSREQISTRMEEQLQIRFDLDEIFVDIIKVNLLHIDVDNSFESLYQEVENRRLQQLVALERQNIIRIDETRLNETQFIQKQAQRNQLIRNAETETVRAQLDQQRLVTNANTDLQQAIILAESDRINRLIRANTRLKKTKATRTLAIDAVKRVALANATLAETQRQNMRVIALGDISRAQANATRDITKAQIAETRAIEGLISVGINATLEIFKIGNDANATASEISLNGDAESSEILASKRAETSHWIMLKETLQLTDESLANLLIYRAMARNANKTLTIDHEAVPLRLLEGNVPSSVTYGHLQT